VIERAVTFGANGSLVGVITEADPSVAKAGAPTVLLFNTGIHHHVGPYRFNVDAARALAARGVASLRFDLSGMGDSGPRAGGKAGLDAALDDVRDAMSFLEKKQATTRFVLVGFCSGVDVAHPLALADARVVGLVTLEGYAYRTLGNRLRKPLRLLDRARWERFVRTRAARWGLGRSAEIAQPVEAGPSVFAREYPTRSEFAKEVLTLSTRGVRTLFVYFGGDTDVSHRGQLREMLRRLWLPRGVEVEFYRDADHIMFRTQDRARVASRIAEFCAMAFGTDVRRLATG
jgi:alpha-beta hydrolase superfamily lysophospholipase